MSKLKTCKECNKEVSKKAKICPHCGVKNRYSRVWIVLFSIIGFFILISMFSQVKESTDSLSSTSVQSLKTNSEITSENDSFSVSQKNAVKKADSYLSFTSFSREGLIRQLKHDGFNSEESAIAVDSLFIDWKKQASLKAESYLSFTSFSCEGLIDQLSSSADGFTEEEAKYGVTQTGLCS